MRLVPIAPSARIGRPCAMRARNLFIRSPGAGPRVTGAGAGVGGRSSRPADGWVIGATIRASGTRDRTEPVDGSLGGAAMAADPSDPSGRDSLAVTRQGPATERAAGSPRSSRDRSQTLPMSEPIGIGAGAGPGLPRLALEAVCARCAGTDRLILGDGEPVCMVCVLGWGSYARLAGGETSETETVGAAIPKRDQTVTALLHWSHRVPVLDCPLCSARS